MLTTPNEAETERARFNYIWNKIIRRARFCEYYCAPPGLAYLTITLSPSHLLTEIYYIRQFFLEKVFSTYYFFYYSYLFL